MVKRESGTEIELNVFLKLHFLNKSVLINRLKHWNDNNIDVDRSQNLNPQKISESVKKSAVATTTTTSTTTTTTKPNRFVNLNDTRAVSQLERLEESLKDSFDKIEYVLKMQ